MEMLDGRKIEWCGREVLDGFWGDAEGIQFLEFDTKVNIDGEKYQDPRGRDGAVGLRAQVVREL